MLVHVFMFEHQFDLLGSRSLTNHIQAVCFFLQSTEKWFKNNILVVSWTRVDRIWLFGFVLLVQNHLICCEKFMGGSFLWC